MRWVVAVAIGLMGCAAEEVRRNSCGMELLSGVGPYQRSYNETINAECLRHQAEQSGGQVTDCVPIGGGMRCVTL